MNNCVGLLLLLASSCLFTFIEYMLPRMLLSSLTFLMLLNGAASRNVSNNVFVEVYSETFQTSKMERIATKDSILDAWQNSEYFSLLHIKIWYFAEKRGFYSYSDDYSDVDNWDYYINKGIWGYTKSSKINWYIFICFHKWTPVLINNV